ncbi:TylF/MycF/NovP-related O-methyltransferase, partial [Staphylococcus aureus]
MTSEKRMKILYKSVAYIVKYKIPGDLVECGVWRGGSAMIMSLSLKLQKMKAKKIFLYDTFAGMTKPKKIDREIKTGVYAYKEWNTRKRKKINT